MLAQLQKFITLLIVAIAVGGALYLKASSPAWALAILLAAPTAYALVLGFEFYMSWRISRVFGDEPARGSELVRAWVGEMLQSPQVFCWRQPFREHAVVDQVKCTALSRGRRGVVFVHGLFCNRAFWTPWMQRLEGTGRAFEAVTLEPVFGSIENYIPHIQAAVQRVVDATGLAPILVCHSMGGLAARAWLAEQGQHSCRAVHHIVTIGTPHLGTWLAQWGYGINARQMRISSAWLQHLNERSNSEKSQPPHAELFTCWYSNADNIVFPHRNAALPDADNRMVRAVAHVCLAFHPRVMHETLALLDQSDLEMPRPCRQSPPL